MLFVQVLQGTSAAQGGKTGYLFTKDHAHTVEEADGSSPCLQVSEEIEEEIIIEGGGDYSVMFDPLDGSSNIDCGVSIGTIYGIFKKPAAEAASVKNVLRVRRCPSPAEDNAWPECHGLFQAH